MTAFIASRPNRAIFRPVCSLFMAVIFAVSLAGCGPPTPDDNDIEYQEGREAVGMEPAEAQQIWRAAIANRQGCEGRILKGQSLAAHVAGKRHLKLPFGIRVSPSDPRSQWRSYELGGNLRSKGQFGTEQGRYSLQNDRICHINLYGMGNDEWCFRLIETSDGNVMEESIDERVDFSPANGAQLYCERLRIEDLGE